MYHHTEHGPGHQTVLFIYSKLWKRWIAGLDVKKFPINQTINVVCQVFSWMRELTLRLDLSDQLYPVNNTTRRWRHFFLQIPKFRLDILYSDTARILLYSFSNLLMSLLTPLAIYLHSLWMKSKSNYETLETLTWWNVDICKDGQTWRLKNECR